ncbi:hypothetical protein DPMN_144114 [Dreissena polymorpha]|uniref:Uncharacterized protein n=1 Tax=Dreissena polymorpha TaxID=45954 RepID=A0A9D4JKB4_DREPO|nr:hypothetical protein DPMN_144114 [Dreissena polymorpha]
MNENGMGFADLCDMSNLVIRGSFSITEGYRWMFVSSEKQTGFGPSSPCRSSETEAEVQSER